MVFQINNHQLTAEDVGKISARYMGNKERKALRNLYTLLKIKEEYTPNDVVNISDLKKMKIEWIETAESAIRPYLK